MRAVERPRKEQTMAPGALVRRAPLAFEADRERQRSLDLKGGLDQRLSISLLGCVGSPFLFVRSPSPRPIASPRCCHSDSSALL